MNWFVCFGNDNADGIEKVKYLQRIDWSRLNINPLSFRLFMSANMMEIGKVIGDNKDPAVWSVSLKKLESKMMTQNWMKIGAVLIDGTSLYQGEREVCVTYSINILWIMRNLLVFVLHLIFSILFVCVFVSPWFSLASHLSAVSFIAPPFHLVLLHGNLISSNTHIRYANAWCLMMKWRCRTIKKSPSTIVGCFKRIKSNRLVDIRKWGIRFISFDSVPFHSKQSHSRMFYRTIFSIYVYRSIE